MRDRESGELVTLAFSATGAHEMDASALAETDTQESRYRVFVTWVGPAGFLNVQEIGGDEEGWYFVRYRVDGDRLFLHVVDEALFASVSSPTPEDLQRIILQHLEDPGLYGDEPGQSTEAIWERAGS
jgi:hypothetical protein